jgi:cytochrome c
MRHCHALIYSNLRRRGSIEPLDQLSNASALLKASMPLGQGGTPSDQEAKDAANFMDAHEPSQHPRLAL